MPADRSGILAQFAHVNEPFLSWDFTLRSENNEVIGSVNRNFAGWGRELLTDTGVYALRMDSESLAQEDSQDPQGQKTLALGMTLDQRAVMLATAVSIDFDYFSRHSHAGHGGGLWPFWWGGGGTATGPSTGEAGAGAPEVGAGEGAMAGAGTMAGYEAMQRGMGRRGSDADASPIASDTSAGQTPQSPGQMPRQDEDVWGVGREDPWTSAMTQDPPMGDDASGNGTSWSDVLSDFFDGVD